MESPLPEISLKETPAQLFSCIFLRSKQGFIHWPYFFLFFPSFFSFLLFIMQLWEFIQKGYKNEDFFTFYNNLSKN